MRRRSDPPEVTDGPTDTLTLALDGWEGPLALLLDLARAQKVDLREISILALVEQYLEYIEQARALKLEIAADYLVMAAWLAYLKSCLLLPGEPEADPSPEEMALRLQLRLQRLDAMREAGARLMARDRLGRDVFARCAAEGLHLVRRPLWQADLFDVIESYGAVRARQARSIHRVSRRPVMSLEEAIRRIEALIGRRTDWTALPTFLPGGGDADYRRSALASSFVAALELAKRGTLELAQGGTFAPLMIRAA